MSAEATGWVFRHSPYRGATFQCHLAVADSVNDQHDNEFWMRQGRLADKARVSRKAANEAMATMVEDGFLAVVEDNSRRGRNADGSYPPNRYRFLFPDAEVQFESRSGVTAGDTSRPLGVTPLPAGVTNGDTSGVTSGDTQPKGSNPREPKQELSMSRLADATPDAEREQETPTEKAQRQARDACMKNPAATRLTRLFRELAAANGVTVPTKGTLRAAEWTLEMDRLLRLGAPGGQDRPAPPAEVEQVIRYAAADEFERATVLSIPKLRKRYDQLRLKALRSNGKPQGLVYAKVAPGTGGEVDF